MDLSKIKIFNLMQSNLNYLGSRQTVISQNIANANTPGYQAKDLKAPDFSTILSTTSTSSLATTNDAHINGTNSATTFKKIGSSSFEATPTGNSVVLEEEMLKLSKVGMDYQETTNIYRKMLEMIKTSIGNN